MDAMGPWGRPGRQAPWERCVFVRGEQRAPPPGGPEGRPQSTRSLSSFPCAQGLQTCTPILKEKAPHPPPCSVVSPVTLPVPSKQPIGVFLP